jgi:hypothetical protein
MLKNCLLPPTLSEISDSNSGVRRGGMHFVEWRKAQKSASRFPNRRSERQGPICLKTPYVGLRGHLISEVTSVYFAGVFPLLRLSYGPDQEKWWPIPDYRADQRQRSHPTTELKPNNHNARPASQCFQFIGSAEPGNNKRVESTTIAKPASPMRSIHRIIPTSTA